jgi:hypothetical protein
MISRSQRRRSEHKTMPVVVGPLCLVHIGAKLVRESVRRKAIVDKKLYLNAC